MSNRVARVNALIYRVISEVLHRNYRSDSVRITISDVSTASDLRKARIYYSVLGEQSAIDQAADFFHRRGSEIQQAVRNEVVLKYFPRFEYCYDPSMHRGAEIIDLLDALEADEAHDG